MNASWLTTMKPSFTNQWLVLPPKEMHQVLEKIKLLEEDPTPDAKVKKQLKYMNGKLHRVRCGDYRIFYTFSDPYVSLLALRRRRDDTYEEDLDAEFLGGLDPDLSSIFKPAQPDWERILAPKVPEKKHLPEPITGELLANLHIPNEYHPRLLLIQTEEDLLSCPGIPDNVLAQLIEFMFPKSLAQVIQQPDLLLDEVDDLLRFKEGELLAFLLRLSPEQERFISWAIKATGPTQVKGGPGTGKSTVALYRVRSLIEKLHKMGQTEPRILFTTYTNALIRSSLQLLQQLLGEDAHHVDVQTADKKVSDILKRAGVAKKTPRESSTLHRLFDDALEQTRFEGNLHQQQAQKAALERLGRDYIEEEINQVIVARQIASLQDYMTARRPGRQVRLGETQKKAIWCVHETYLQCLKKAGFETWQQARVRAEAIVSKDHQYQSYDAVIVDEAQDLDPGVLRLLIALCKNPNRFFITADANQSIYGSGFNWTDVHECLRFQGRTSVLQANYRSTREIGEAAQSYLVSGELDPEPIERIYINSGPPPAVRAVKSEKDELQLLARFLMQAASEFHLGLGGCAVLCPTEKSGEAIAAGLSENRVKATFMKGRELDLSCPGVKVLTLNSSKGLEFPVVALAGFFNTWFANIANDDLDEEQEEEIARKRRLLFVGMTRAMRALLVVVPAETRSPLLTRFDDEYWNLGGN